MGQENNKGRNLWSENNLQRGFYFEAHRLVTEYLV